MPEETKKRSRKAGLPPGTLVHIGERKTETVTVRCLEYDDEHFQERSVDLLTGCVGPKKKAGVTWVDICGVHDVAIIERLGQAITLHPLTLEDIVNTHQRPKLESFDDYIYLVLKLLHFDDQSHQIEIEQVSFVLGTNYVLSFQEMEKDVFDPVRERLRMGRGRIRKSGADYLLYTLIDATVDSYFVILEKIGERIEEIEEQLISDPRPETMHQIHRLKREMMYLRKSTWPLREVIGNLERDESSLVTETTRLFLRDVYDHTIQSIDTVETFRDMLSGMLDLYLSSISNKMNEVMKVLTIIATLFIPITFVVGIYGMNFENMPELKWPFGYAAVWILMVAIAISLLIYFKRKKWL
ncbi:MAG: magnesium/cobalt transporter CorA [bacterium]|nr:magnesium/cobalt transporter CorA [bacterium]